MPDPEEPDDHGYAEDELERQISDMDAPAFPTERLTAEELREPTSLDEEVRRDQGSARTPHVRSVPIELDVPDEEGELIAESTEVDDDLASEESAMWVTTEPPGATDDEDDGYGDER